MKLTNRSTFRLILAASAALALLSASGCVSNKKFKTTVGEITGRVDGVQSDVEKHGTRLDTLEKKDTELQDGIARVDQAAGVAQRTGETALSRADEAAKLAKGKVLWQVTLTNSDLRFSPDRAELTDSGRAVLDEMVARLKSFDKMVFVEIQGHTDSTGNPTYNKVLGEKRAEIVRDYLHESGLPLNLMSTISYGEDRPIADNTTRDGRSQNRRVEVLVLE
jgi:outer membrane protein OmpA-like peptidoglycan-associated protein